MKLTLIIFAAAILAGQYAGFVVWMCGHRLGFTLGFVVFCVEGAFTQFCFCWLMMTAIDSGRKDLPAKHTKDAK